MMNFIITAEESFKYAWRSAAKNDDHKSELKLNDIQKLMYDIKLRCEAGMFTHTVTKHRHYDLKKNLKDLGYKVKIDGNWMIISWGHINLSNR